MKFKNLLKLLTEMPQAIAFIDNPPTRMSEINDFIANEEPEDIREIKGVVFEIYHLRHGNNNEFVFVNAKTNQVRGLLSGNKINNNGLEIDLIEAEKNSIKGSLMYELFCYALEQFDFIMSDSLLTLAGFNFYQRNFDEFKKEYDFYVYDLNEKIRYEVNNNKELEKYFNVNDRHKNYRFIIS